MDATGGGSGANMQGESSPRRRSSWSFRRSLSWRKRRAAARAAAAAAVCEWTPRWAVLTETHLELAANAATRGSVVWLAVGLSPLDVFPTPLSHSHTSGSSIWGVSLMGTPWYRGSCCPHVCLVHVQSIACACGSGVVVGLFTEQTRHSAHTTACMQTNNSREQHRLTWLK